MRVPESWLREFCNPNISTAQLAEVLTMGGFEVEQMEPTAPEFSQVVIAEIISVEKHPAADKLQICQVNVGQEQLQIVCGAPNARVGIKVPCALVGAELPAIGGKAVKIKVGKLRGVESYGMLCSNQELGIAGEYPDGLLELEATAPVGADIRQYLALDETIFTLKLTPNLSHALSIYGLAREVAALTGANLKTPAVRQATVKSETKFPVEIADGNLCSKFSCRIIKKLNAAAPTPAWMVRRLLQCGQRPVNVLADISNYIMFEYGQPTHFFDLAKVNKKVQIRWAQPGEKCHLLNGKEVLLDESVGVVADAQKILAIGGIMGGADSAVNAQTTEVLLEAAHWQTPAIVGRARKMNFATESSYRFERGVDAKLTSITIERISNLVSDICGGDMAVINESLAKVINRPKIDFRSSRASKIIGMPISQQQCKDIFKLLGCDISEHGEDKLIISPPSFRLDLTIEEDLVEEVIRLIGYHNLPVKTPQAGLQTVIRSESKISAWQMRNKMVNLGYFETINYSFVPDKWERDLADNLQPIAVINPIASQMNVMRSSLLGSLLHTVKFNLDRKIDRIKLFEVATVFKKNSTIGDSLTSVAGFEQTKKIAAAFYGPALATGWQSDKRWVDFYDMKGDLETFLAHTKVDFKPAKHPALHPGRSAEIYLAGTKIGVIGELHPKWQQEYDLAKPVMLFEIDFAPASETALPAYQSISPYQPVLRDIAIVVDDKISFAQVLAVINQAKATTNLTKALLFDVYKPEQQPTEGAEKSLAIRLTLASPTATLTEEEIELTVKQILHSLVTKLAAKLRK